MAIVDERGRVFGRLNLLDAILLVLLAGLIPLGYAAYLLFRDQPARLASISPSNVEQTPDLRVIIKGENLRPYMRVSADSHQATDFYFRSISEAEIPFAHLPPGTYDIVLYDYAQERSRLPDALTIRPSALPGTEVVAAGAFGNLDAAGAAKITPGLDLPDTGRVLAVGKPVRDLTQVFSAPGLVGVPIANAWRVPATVLFRCYIKTQQGRPNCVVGDTAIAPPNLLMLPTPLGKTPFQIDQVRSPHPLEPVPVRLRISGQPSVLSLIRPGDVDLGGTSNELAAIARVASVGPLRRIGETAAEIDVNLLAQLQRVDGAWLYNSIPLRVGSHIALRTARYESGGIVIEMPPPDRRGTEGQ